MVYKYVNNKAYLPFDLYMNKRTIIFDFDWTIADTLHLGVDLYNNIAHEYNCNTIGENDIKKIQSMRPQQVLDDYWVNILKIPFLLLRLRKELKKRITELKPINGIVKAIKDIKNYGFNLGIMTSNTKSNVRSFLDLNGLNNVFDFIHSGRHLFWKNKVIKRLLKERNIANEDVMYIWDETRDIEASQKVGIPIISVSRWFNSRKILESLNPNVIVDNPKDLLECLKKI